jgi:signal transduction histidine kinase
VGQVALCSGRSEEDYRQVIVSMLEESKRLEMLIQRLLELASVEGRTSPVELRILRLDEFVGGCIKDWAVLAELKGQQIELDLQGCSIATDQILLRQVLQNLVDNAIKYSPHGSTIQVTVRDIGAYCEVTVSDEGPGLTPESQARLAERFFRPDSARTRSHGGFGLGLAISKAYMRLLRGTLDYVARPTSGSTFRLTLPKHDAPKVESVG